LEPSVPSYGSPEECEAAFYDAFRAGNLGAMQHVWGEDAAVACIHPGRAPLAGRSAVLDSWRAILGASGGVEVRFDCQRRVRSSNLAVHIGVELIGAPGDDAAQVTVTNVYVLAERGWKLLLHHAGPVHRDAAPRGPLH